MSKTIDSLDGLGEAGSAGLRGERPEALREYSPVPAPLSWPNQNWSRQSPALSSGVASRTLPRRLVAWGGVGLILAAAVTVLWFSVLRERLIVKRWGTVVPGKIYRSGQISQYLIRPTLQQHHIKHIICMTSLDPQDVDQQVELATAKELGVECKFFPLNGRGQGKVENFTGAVVSLAQSAKQGEPALVHCHAGAQRTGGVVAAYRLLMEGRSPEFVVDELRQFGWNPNRDQVLLEYVNAHLEEAAVELVTAGCLEKVPQPLPVLR